MRAVLDTNIVVSALIWGGTPYKLLQAATDGDLELFTSPARLTEQRSSLEQAIELYGELATSVSPLSTPRAVPRDVDDDQVIAAALAAKVDIVISGDADLLSMGAFEGIAIITAREAVDRFKAKK